MITQMLVRMMMMTKMVTIRQRSSNIPKSYITVITITITMVAPKKIIHHYQRESKPFPFLKVA